LTHPDIALAEQISHYYADPLGFVLDCFPWGEGELAGETGPDDNQAEFLTSLGEEVKRRNFDGHTPVKPIRMCISSGHGTGKSAMGAWITWWIISTRPGSIGTISAGTYKQLKERTWSAIKRWGKMCATSGWFEVQAEGIYSKEDPENWKAIIQSCAPENAQSFAGQHARTSTSWYLFDEASEIERPIWETAGGGLSDGEPMMFAWGQMVRNTGAFYECCFGKEKARWNSRRVDSRTSKFTNKEEMVEDMADWGEDSDRFRVRWLGLPPNASELQFIDKGRIVAAQERLGYPLDDDPLIAGFDVSGGGSAWNVIRFRRGIDARTIPPVRLSGAKGERNMLVAIAAELLSDTRAERKITAMFIDSAFGSPIVERLRSLGHENVFEVTFGAGSPDIHQLNWRAYMWNRMKDWLMTGMLPKNTGVAEPNENDSLASQLALPGFHHQKSKLVLESKADMQKRGESSPDDADALALTFAQNVAPVTESRRGYTHSYQGPDSWMA